MKKKLLYEKIGEINKRIDEALTMYSKDSKLKKIQQVNLEMAQYFVDFCKSHDLLCYFCGGGAIGAIRHKGFIPWDDDLDFFMPRKDYERLGELWGEEPHLDKFVLLKPNKELNDRNSFTTIRNIQTTFIKTYQGDLDLPHGIQLDIFPLDTAPKKSFDRKKQKIWAMIYAIYRSQQVPKNHGKFVELIGKILLNSVSSTGKYKIWCYAERQMTKYNQQPTDYVTELCVGPRYMGNIYPAKDFSKALWVPFEDTKMPVPVGYDDYLKKAFGDYMKLPPENSRLAHHEAVFIDPDNSFKNYKGIYYLTKGEDKK